MRRLLPALSVALALGCGSFDDPTLDERFDPATAAPPPERPAVAPSATRNLLWGDLHVHSGYSLDAWGYGTTATPAEAYAFARGAPMRLADGHWRATDIVVEGISITDNYREQFESLLRTHSFAELLERMRRKTRRRDAA